MPRTFTREELHAFYDRALINAAGTSESVDVLFWRYVDEGAQILWAEAEAQARSA